MLNFLVNLFVGGSSSLKFSKLVGIMMGPFFFVFFHFRTVFYPLTLAFSQFVPGSSPVNVASIPASEFAYRFPPPASLLVPLSPHSG